ncbi:MAG: hypothetical protein ABFD97_14000 [Syntrophobacter sp.]
MNKRGIFIGVGTAFLVFGIAGIALLKTNLLKIPAGPGLENRLETPAPQPSPEVPGSVPGPSAKEGTLPPAPETSPSPGAVSKNETPPASPSPMPSQQPQAEKNDKTVAVPQVGKGERRYPRPTDFELPKVQNNQSARATGPASRSMPRDKTWSTNPQSQARQKSLTGQGRQPVTIRVNFNPAKANNIQVARVHLGDRIAINVRRIGQAERQVYLGFDLGGGMVVQRNPNDRRTVESSGALIAPVNDRDQLILEGHHALGESLVVRLDSKDGAILKLGAKPLHGNTIRRREPSRGDGYYKVEIVIYPGNKWNIMPRSYL